jgi:hypothetical protein
VRVELLASIARRRRCQVFLWYSPAAALPWLVGLGNDMGSGNDPIQALGAALLRAAGQWGPPTDPTEPIDREVLHWLAW